MIVKFHARGKGGGSGPVDYLLGREHNREGATVLQGNPEEVRAILSMPRHLRRNTRQVFCRSRRRSCRLEGVKSDGASFEACTDARSREKSVQHPVGGAPGQGTA
ncbi:hypothetical protein [Escherichia coli]|uniref:hypothetical protein n=1 Tax=Escherichia coli TaxID=562 RepID=UPI0035140D2F